MAPQGLPIFSETSGNNKHFIKQLGTGIDNAYKATCTNEL
jgi:hypothetical protein